MQQAVVIQKMRKLRAELTTHGNLPTSGETLEQWLNYWLTTVERSRGPRTTQTYRSYIAQYLIPCLGKVRVDRLDATHIHKLHDYMRGLRKKNGDPLSSTTIHHAQTILGTALADAQREGRAPRNAATIVKRPNTAKGSRGALSADQAVQLLTSSAGDPYASRWAMALLTGARQGECLGLELDRVDLDRNVLTLSWQLQRLPWSHGCEPLCMKRPASCLQRRVVVPDGYEGRQVQDGLWLTRPKSKAGWRVIPLVDPFRAILAEHQATTSSSRGVDAISGGLVWSASGRPIAPRDDWSRWKGALERAGLPDFPLHSARHATATLLLACGVPDVTRQAIMGHSSAASSVRYEHVDPALAAEGLERVSALLRAVTEAREARPSAAPALER